MVPTAICVAIFDRFLLIFGLGFFCRRSVVCSNLQRKLCFNRSLPSFFIFRSDFRPDDAQWKTWSADVPFSGRASVGTVSFGGNMYVLGGQTAWSHPDLNEVWASADGLSNWVQQTPPEWSARMRFFSVVFNDQVVIGLGMLQNGSVSNDIWASSDMVHWTQQPAFPGTARYGAGAVVLNNDLYVLKGDAAGSYAHDMWYTSNLTTWTQITEGAALSARMEYPCATFNGAIYVFGGNQYSSAPGNDLVYSTGI